MSTAVNYEKIRVSIAKLCGSTIGANVSYGIGIFLGNTLSVSPIAMVTAEGMWASNYEKLVEERLCEFNEKIVIDINLAARVAKGQWLMRTQMAAGGTFQMPDKDCKDYDDCFTTPYRFFAPQDYAMMVSGLQQINMIYHAIYTGMLEAGNLLDI